MSAIVIAGDTSGTITIQAPAVAGTNILTVPAVTGGIVAATASNGSNGQILVADSTGSPYWAGLWNYVTSNTTLSAGLYMVDASNQANINLTLPASPTTGSTITLQDANNSWSTNLPVLLNNGQTIMGSSSPLTLDASNITLTIWFNGSDWRLV